MSSRFERVTRTFEENSALDLFRELYHVPVLAVLMSFMLWVRTREWETYVVDGEVLFSGNDAWYHYRMVEYTTRHWPFTMPFDVWTNFPEGTSVGQFGTLYDQLIATAALIVGLGSPTQQQVAMTVLFTPAVFGVLTVIPVYLLGKRYGGRPGGLLAALVLALTPGQFFTRSMVGFSDHHVAETFFMAWAALAVVVAVTVAEREKPVYELFVEREFDALRRPVGYAALAGVAIALFVWTWPPAVFFGGTVAAFLLVHMLYRYVRRAPPEFDAVAGVVIFLVAAVLVALRTKTLDLSISEFSIAHPLLLLGAAAAIGSVAAGARLWDDRVPADRSFYPVAVVGGVVVVAGLGFLLLPDFASFLIRQIQRGVGLGASASQRTVAEATPLALSNAPQFFRESYGLAFFVAIGGALLVLYRYLRSDDPSGHRAFVLVWFVFLVLATLTQRRFDYYLVLPVAVLAGVVVAWAIDLADADAVSRLDDIEGYQVMAVITVLLLVAAPLVAGSNTVVARADADRNDNAVADGVEFGVAGWQENLEFMATQTPPEGTYGRPDAEQSLQYYGTYPRQTDYQYGPGEYGVLSWWDYGHWITVQGERPPVANPFQQNARRAANVLLATNESHAVEIMEGDGDETRYVMLDYKLGVAGTNKFTAPATWEQDHDVSGDPRFVSENGIALNIYNRETFQRQAVIHRPRSYESMRVRLYQFHGSALSPQTRQGVVVIDWDEVSQQGSGRVLAVAPQNGRALRQFQNMSAARQFVERDGSSQIGGLPGVPSKAVPALEHFRLVKVSNRTAPTRQQYPWAKTFERVPGATVNGQGPPNTTVTASVRMRMPTSNGTFTYTQNARTGPDGEFTMTLPYSTEGYENWGPEQGHTNVSVRAAGPYQIRAGATQNESGTFLYADQLNVSEAKVIGADEEPIEMEISAVPLQLQDRNESNSSSAVAPPSPSETGGSSLSDGSATTDAPGATVPTGASDADAWRGATAPARRIAPVRP